MWLKNLRGLCVQNMAFFAIDILLALLFALMQKVTKRSRRR